MKYELKGPTTTTCLFPQRTGSSLIVVSFVFAKLAQVRGQPKRCIHNFKQTATNMSTVFIFSHLGDLPIVDDNARSPPTSFTFDAPRIPAIRPYSCFQYYKRVTRHPSTVSSRWESAPASPPTAASPSSGVHNARTVKREAGHRTPRRRGSTVDDLPALPLGPANNHVRKLSSVCIVLDSAPRQPKRSSSPHYCAHRPKGGEIQVGGLEGQAGETSDVKYYACRNIVPMAA